jgi:hypothetical protein
MAKPRLDRFELPFHRHVRTSAVTKEKGREGQTIKGI